MRCSHPRGVQEPQRSEEDVSWVMMLFPPGAILSLPEEGGAGPSPVLSVGCGYRVGWSGYRGILNVKPQTHVDSICLAFYFLRNHGVGLG